MCFDLMLRNFQLQLLYTCNKFFNLQTMHEITSQWYKIDDNKWRLNGAFHKRTFLILEITSLQLNGRWWHRTGLSLNLLNLDYYIENYKPPQRNGTSPHSKRTANLYHKSPSCISPYCFACLLMFLFFIHLQSLYLEIRASTSL